MPSTIRPALPVAATALVAALAAAGPAQAARPGVSTGGPSRVTPTSVTFTGAVDPNGKQTSYAFEYGPTTAYGARTADVAAGDADGRLAATGDAGGLVPSTRYHYRLVAINGDGVRRGADRTFTTARQPLGLTVAATPAAVQPGQPFTLTGTLAGTGAAERRVGVQVLPYPFNGIWAPYGNELVTDASGAFSLPVLSIPGTTQFRAVVASNVNIASAPLTVALDARVSTSVSATRVKRGRTIRFTGTLRPRLDGAAVQVQKLTTTGRWVTVGTAHGRDGSAASSVYGKTVTVPRGGSYRVVTAGAGAVAPGTGRTVRVTSYR